MQLISDDVWLAAISAVGGEDFDTGNPSLLRGVWMEEYQTLSLDRMTVEGVTKAIEIRTADIAIHGLVKNSVLRRVADDTQQLIRRFERADGGVTVLILAK